MAGWSWDTGEMTGQPQPTPKPAKPRLLQDGRDMFWSLVPIVIVSGHTDEKSVQVAFEVGASDYLSKPFTPSQLRARLQACLLRVR